METFEINIGHRQIGAAKPCFVIAEAGVNHNGSLDLALDMVDAAANAGSDAIKFQTFKAHKVAAFNAPKAGYQLRTSDPNESQQKMLKRLELSDSDFDTILERCRQKQIMFLSTPYDERSLQMLVHMGLSAVKLSSTDLTNPFMLRASARTGLPVICSTGMADIDEVARAVEILRSSGCKDLALLHCVSSYPADPSHANLLAMKTMTDVFHVPIGYSDHTTGIEVPIAAAALGACIIEKHFTLDRKMPGPDHAASCQPTELAAMVEGIRKVQSALGDGIKRPTAEEIDNRKKVRRSLAAARRMEAGTIIESDALTALRPGTGIAPWEMERVIGRTIKSPLEAGQLLTEDQLL